MITIQADNLSKKYNRQLIFKDVSFFSSEKYNLAITGKNGSGKSTLLKIIARLVSATTGKILHFNNEFQIFEKDLNKYISIVSPYLMLYEELTALEHLKFVSKLKNNSTDVEIENILKKFSIYSCATKKVGSYSSGMVQRLRYCIALISKPKILLLDEPTSNLDSEGEELVFDIMQNTKSCGINLIYATNQKSELKFADNEIDLNEYLR